MKYYYYINLDERGQFYADVRDQRGNTVFEIWGFDIFEDGWMDHPKDVVGLEEYLEYLGIIKSSDRLLIGENKMKIKKSDLRQIIREEIKFVLNEKISDKHKELKQYRKKYPEYTDESIAKALDKIKKDNKKLSATTVDYYIRPKSAGGLGYGKKK